MAAERQLHDLFNGDPEEHLEYHQDYKEDFWWSYFARPEVTLTTLFVFGAFVYQVLYILDFNLLSLPELAWNSLVYLTPSRLIDAVENYTSPLRITNPAARSRRTHAEKSNAMRRILGLDTGGIIGSVAQAGRRRFSTLPGMRIGAYGSDGRPAGLGNWDNSCYQNSVLQGLASLDSLPEYLTTPNTEDMEIDVESKPAMRMAEALHGLIATLNDSSNNGKRIWTPSTLKSMSSWQQQDAQEYFSKVLDEIDKEVGKAVDSMRKSQGLETDEPSSSASSTSSESLPISTVRNPLEGLIAQRVGCMTCGHSEGLSMIPFNCLTVPLGESFAYNVSQCLNEYTKLEFIEGVECGKCTLLKTRGILSTLFERVKDNPESDVVRKNTTERLTAITEALEEDDYEDKTLLQKCKIPAKSRVTSTKTRQAVVARPPKSLVVHFNRSLFDEYTGELRKNYADVRFPKILDLGPWCLGSSGTAADASVEEWLLSPNKSMIATTARPSRLRGPLYELRAVVTHYGRHENGHYICYKKHPTSDTDEKGVVKDQWWRLSDDDVMKVSEEDVLDQGGVFMLFFDNIEPGVTLEPENAPAEPITFRMSSHASELMLATSIPLPDVDDSDISEGDERGSSLATWGESAATSVSEFDDDNDDYDRENYARENYEPTQALLLPHSISKTGVNQEGGGARKTGIRLPANMLVV